MVVTNNFWKTKHQTLWTDEFQASPKDLPGREKKQMEMALASFMSPC